MKTKGGGTKGEKDEKDEDEDEEDEDDKKPPFVKESNDITTPQDSKYNSEEAARKDGDGKMMRPKPKFDTKDYGGTGSFKTAKKS